MLLIIDIILSFLRLKDSNSFYNEMSEIAFEKQNRKVESEHAEIYQANKQCSSNIFLSWHSLFVYKYSRLYLPFNSLRGHQACTLFT